MVAGGTAMLPGHHPSRRDQREGRDDLRLDGIVSHLRAPFRPARPAGRRTPRLDV